MKNITAEAAKYNDLKKSGISMNPGDRGNFWTRTTGDFFGMIKCVGNSISRIGGGNYFVMFGVRPIIIIK